VRFEDAEDGEPSTTHPISTRSLGQAKQAGGGQAKKMLAGGADLGEVVV